MDINEFFLERVIFEYRYSPNFLVWDHVGRLWTDAAAKWPRLKKIASEPNLTSFRIDDACEISIGSEKASVSVHDPKPDLADFADKVVFLMDLTGRHLEIGQYARIGLRLLYFKKYSSNEAASNGVAETKMLSLPQGPHFGIEGAFSLPEYAVRWEGRTTGVTIRLRAEGRKIDFDPPLGVHELKSHHEEKFGVVLDIDSFTKGTLTSAQFRAQDWIKNAMHVARRDSRNFLRA